MHQEIESRLHGTKNCYMELIPGNPVLGCFVTGCFVTGCFVTGCFVTGCFVTGGQVSVVGLGCNGWPGAGCWIRCKNWPGEK